MATPDEPGNGRSAMPPAGSAWALFSPALSQLSVTAWLPGAVLFVSITALAWFRMADGVNFDELWPFLQRNWIPALGLSAAGLLASILLTQTFTFGAVQTLEGYWGAGGPASWVTKVRIRRQLTRMQRSQGRRDAALATSWTNARAHMLADGVKPATLRVLDSLVTGMSLPFDVAKEELREAARLNWWQFAEPWDVARLSSADRELAEFPTEARIMPTRLGNILRAAEDSLETTGGLEAAVTAPECLPARILHQHDQFRVRLDMYCTLVFVAVTAALVSVPMLDNLTLPERILVPLAFFALSWASYRAALSCARGYGVTLRILDASITPASRQGT